MWMSLLCAGRHGDFKAASGPHCVCKQGQSKWSWTRTNRPAPDLCARKPRFWRPHASGLGLKTLQNITVSAFLFFLYLCISYRWCAVWDSAGFWFLDSCAQLTVSLMCHIKSHYKCINRKHIVCSKLNIHITWDAPLEVFAKLNITNIMLLLY